MGPPLGGRRTFWIVGHVARQYSSTSARMVKSKKAKVDVELADVEISDGFSKPIEQVFGVLTDPKKNKGAGIPPSFSTKIGQEWSTDDMYCKNLHVVPNKLIVQEWRAKHWEDTGSSTPTLVIRLEKGCYPTKIFLSHLNVPANEKDSIAEVWTKELFGRIREALDDQSSYRPPRKGATICHFEIPSKNPAENSKFYADVFGWNVADWGGYVGYNSGPRNTDWGFVDGGFPKVDDDREIAGVRIASHMPYYQCDIEEHIKKVVAAGGKVIKEKYEIMGGHGFAADCQDLDGNIFALYSQK